MLDSILTIWKREIKGYFYTSLAYVFLGIFSFLMGLMFVFFLNAYLLYTKQSMWGASDVITIDRLAEVFYANMNIILMFILPFFTMRLLSEESRQNTLTLLLTSPVRVWDIVLAKFSAALSILVIMLAMTFVFPIFLTIYKATGSAGPDWGVVGTTYFGFLLVGAAYIAIGLFWSSITESQLIAVVMTFASNFILWLISVGAGSATGWKKSFLQHISINEQFSPFLKGTFETSAFVYMISLIFFALFLTQRSLDSRAWRN